MKTILIPLAVICLLFASPARAQLNNATGSNYGFVMKPLFPHPLAFSHASGIRVPDICVLTVRFCTNCRMSQARDAEVLAVALGDVGVQNAWYSTDNEITVEPKRKEVRK